jgi:hypothetical protein
VAPFMNTNALSTTLKHVLKRISEARLKLTRNNSFSIIRTQTLSQTHTNITVCRSLAYG